MLKLTRQSINLLRHRRVPQPAYSVGVLRIQCFKNKPIIARNLKKFKHYIKLRSIHYPVQYICKTWPFRYLQLSMRRPVLIPRFESEYMVEILLHRLKSKYQPEQVTELKFVDYGCGTGALGLSLAKELGMAGTMVDIEAKCVELTRRNLSGNSDSIDVGKVRVLQGDMCELLDLIADADVVVSNPPYLSADHYDQYLQPQIKLFEDRKALIADENGLKFIRVLTQAWRNRSKPGIMMLEFDGRDLRYELPEVEPYVINDQYQQMSARIQEIQS